jgi:ribosomal protein S18 acetylase RimI-like enzyme
MLQLRLFRAADDAELLSWFSSREELRRFAGDNVAWPLTVDQLDRWRADPQVVAWSACPAPRTDVVVGHVQLVRTEPTTGLLARVAVSPDRRGQGLGTALVTAALEQAQQLGVRRLRLNVDRDNDPAIRLYASLGFDDLGALDGRPDVKRMGRELIATPSRGQASER